ncbi:MAG: hypothetical protein LBS45_12255 [Synergistaceae bacterium]|jgi:hypothetical protein|nr:hypothetical protein [Synergistaceae bacterium]
MNSVSTGKLEMVKPLIFSTPMVQAILSGEKTQTRRVTTPPTFPWPAGRYRLRLNNDGAYWLELIEGNRPMEEYFPCRKSRILPGDYLWVRETWRETGVISAPYAYKASEEKLAFLGETGNVLGFGYKWRPSIHMPRKAARLFLHVQQVRVERLQDITESDSRAEGFAGVEEFANFWDSLVGKVWKIGKDGEAREVNVNGWEANPWVWVCEFERVVPEGEL